MTDLDRKLSDLLGAAAAGTDLPERLRRPSMLLPEGKRARLRTRMAGVVAAALLLVATAGVTAAQSGLHAGIDLADPAGTPVLAAAAGTVSATGASTGPHLHFEVRQDGKPVDPLTWLP